MATYTKEEQNFIRQLEREIEAVATVTPKERQALYQAAEQGDNDAIERICELMTSDVLNVAKEKHLDGIHIGDLIQEGHLSLFESLKHLAEKEAELSYEAFTLDAIRKGMDDFIMETANTAQSEHDIATKLNLLIEAAEYLIEEYGEVTMEDVASYTKLDADEINELLRIAGEEGLFKEEEA